MGGFKGGGGVNGELTAGSVYGRVLREEEGLIGS